MMSRGLGKWQVAYIAAMQELEREHGAGKRFYLEYITERAYALSPELQALHQRHKQASQAFMDRLEAESNAGDRDASRLLLLTSALARPDRFGRSSRRSVPRAVVYDINPTRIVRLLERRGLVKRGYPRGNAALTDAGRQFKCPVKLSAPA
jgi:hypothetical protein